MSFFSADPQRTVLDSLLYLFGSHAFALPALHSKVEFSYVLLIRLILSILLFVLLLLQTLLFLVSPILFPSCEYVKIEGDDSGQSPLQV